MLKSFPSDSPISYPVVYVFCSGKLAKFKRIRAHSSSSSSDSACDSNSYLVLSSSSDVQEIDAHNSDDSIPSEPSVDAADCHRNVPARDQVLLSKCSSRPSWHSPTVSVASNSRHHPVSVKGLYLPLKHHSRLRQICLCPMMLHCRCYCLAFGMA